MADFPVSPEQLGTAYLSRILDAQVADFTWAPIGAGLVGDSARINLTYAPGHTGPPSIAAKFPAADPTSLATARMLKLYEKEVGFYSTVAPHVAIRTPAVYCAQWDGETGDFLLLMEDLAPAEQGDQLESCNFAQASAAITQIAALHGPTYGNAALLGLPCVQPEPQARAFAAAHYKAATEKFCALYAGRMEPALLDICAQLGARSSALFSDAPPAGPCIIHGDFRLDNILFDINGGAEPMATLDWQTLAAGDPLVDVGYFMGAGIAPDLRRSHEAQLLALYRAELARHGGPQLSDQAMHEGYARGALHGISTAVFSAAFVEHNDRSEAIFLSMAQGAAELTRDLDALAILEK